MISLSHIDVCFKCLLILNHSFSYLEQLCPFDHIVLWALRKFVFVPPKTTKIYSSLSTMSSLRQSNPYIALCQKVDRIEPTDPLFFPSLTTFVIFSSNHLSPPNSNPSTTLNFFYLQHLADHRIC
jgi:hypothetical protein